MAADYPGSIVSFVAKADGVDWVYADHMNSVQEEIEAIETELGTDVAGSVTDLKTRLAESLAGDGTIQLNSNLDGNGQGLTDVDYITLNQTADNVGLVISGYDDKSGESVEIYIAGAGDTVIDTSDELLIRLGDDAGTDHVKIHDSGWSIIWRLDSDGNIRMEGELNMNSQDIDNIKTATYVAEVDNGNSGASATIDWRDGHFQRITLTNATPTLSFTDPSGPCEMRLKLIQDGTGSRNPVWPANVKWRQTIEPVWSTGAGDIDFAILYFDGADYWGWGELNYG